MPANSKNKSANERLAAWINQGLKRPNWSARRVSQMALLIALGVMVATLYLVQSSQIVTSTRQVQLLREELAPPQPTHRGVGRTCICRFRGAGCFVSRSTIWPRGA